MVRVRILVTNGTRTLDLAFVQHTGTDVYWGSTRSDGKHSYHASGKLHRTQSGKKYDESWHTPLQEISGIHHLVTHSFTTGIVDVAADRYLYSGRKSDSVMIIDTRSLPKAEWVYAGIGLLRPYRLELLARMIATEEAIGLKSRQLLVSSEVTPWVYVHVFTGDVAQLELFEGVQED